MYLTEIARMLQSEIRVKKEQDETFSLWLEHVRWNKKNGMVVEGTIPTGHGRTPAAAMLDLCHQLRATSIVDIRDGRIFPLSDLVHHDYGPLTPCPVCHASSEEINVKNGSCHYCRQGEKIRDFVPRSSRPRTGLTLADLEIDL